MRGKNFSNLAERGDGSDEGASYGSVGFELILNEGPEELPMGSDNWKARPLYIKVEKRMEWV